MTPFRRRLIIRVHPWFLMARKIFARFARFARLALTLFRRLILWWLRGQRVHTTSRWREPGAGFAKPGSGLVVVWSGQQLECRQCWLLRARARHVRKIRLQESARS